MINKNSYHTPHIYFVVPDWDTATRIFEKGLQLPIRHTSNLRKSYALNENTILYVQLFKPGRGLWGMNLDLFVSTKKLLEIKKRLESGPEEIKLKKVKGIYGKTSNLLTITTTEIYHQVSITDRQYNMKIEDPEIAQLLDKTEEEIQYHLMSLAEENDHEFGKPKSNNSEFN